MTQDCPEEILFVDHGLRSAKERYELSNVFQHDEIGVLIFFHFFVLPSGVEGNVYGMPTQL